MSERQQQETIRSGVAGLDEILGGGLPPHYVYLVQGDPGAGKTTLALQFLIEGARNGEKCMYLTLSETERELQNVAKSHGWDLSGITIFEQLVSERLLRGERESTMFHPAEIELGKDRGDSARQGRRGFAVARDRGLAR